MKELIRLEIETVKQNVRLNHKIPSYLNNKLNHFQLLNHHSAAGLSYGMFRRKQIQEKAETLLIYDMGASSTVASILEYRLEFDKKENEKNPVDRKSVV